MLFQKRQFLPYIPEKLRFKNTAELIKNGSPAFVKKLAGTLRDILTNYLNITVALTASAIAACAGIGLAAAVAVYAALKPYPADYDAEGKLIVDGAKMANDTFKGVGWSSAFLAGWVLERRTVRFTTEIPLGQKLARTVIGLTGFYAVSLILVPLLKAWISGPAGTMVSCFFQMFYVSYLFPLLCKYIR